MYASDVADRLMMYSITYGELLFGLAGVFSTRARLRTANLSGNMVKYQVDIYRPVAGLQFAG